MRSAFEAYSTHTGHPHSKPYLVGVHGDASRKHQGVPGFSCKHKDKLLEMTAGTTDRMTAGMTDRMTTGLNEMVLLLFSCGLGPLL